ncbi:unnamed protein product [Calypogeia fissa]
MWIEYNSLDQTLTVFLTASGTEKCHTNVSFSDPLVCKPTTPILFGNYLSNTMSPDGMFMGVWGSLENMSTGGNTGSEVKVNFWTFNSEGPAPDFPRDGNGLLLNPEKVKNDQQRKSVEKTARILEETIPRAIVVLILSLTICVLYRRVARLTAPTKKYEIEKGLLDQGPQNLKYRVLRSATKGFSSTELLGSGAFGSV